MKILIVLSNPGVGGTETFVLTMAPFLERLGCTVAIYNMWSGSLMEKQAGAAGLAYDEAPGPGRLLDGAALWRIIQKVRRDGIAVVFGFGIRVAMALRLLRPVLRGVPVIIGLRGLDLWRRWYHVWPDRLTEFACDLFVANSRAVAQQRMAREKTKPSRITVICNGIDVGHFDASKALAADRQSLGIPLDKIVVTTVANFRYQKGHEFLLQVISSMVKKHRDVCFVWVGAGSLKEKLQAQAETLTLSGVILFKDYVADVRPVLVCTDIYAMPSVEEGMPRCLMEAMSMGIPCVATRVGGTGEVVEDGVSGFLADYGDVAAFERGLERLIEDSALRQAIGRASRQRMCDFFDINKIAKQYLKLFELLLSGYRDGEKIQLLLHQAETGSEHKIDL